MANMAAETAASMKMIPTLEQPDFSLALGGPLFQLYRRAHLSGDALELLHRRVVVVALIAWLPLLLLSLLQGHALAGVIKIPFLYDVEANVRFLVAIPMLIAGEVFVHSHISPLIRWFVERGIVSKADSPRFKAAINAGLRARNSVVLEVTLLALVYTVGLWGWRSHIAMAGPTWYAVPDKKHLNLTLAGFWYVFVSIPIFQFLLWRWYLRLGLWFRLLWQISRLDLRLTAVHPDRAGGIGFLGETSYAFGPILFAQGAMLAGVIGNRILYDGQKLLSFRMEAIGLIAFIVLVVLGPLVMFTPQLERTKFEGSSEYGLLANRYMFGFEEKWIQGSAPETKALLGSADVQALGDLGSIYSAVDEMRIIPFGPRQVIQLAGITAAPFLPLAFTVFSANELLSRLLKMFL